MYIYTSIFIIFIYSAFCLIGVNFLNRYSSWSLEKRNAMLFIEKY